jgi:16S rRNA A1518/A1519 N6-dimethyltransferase RsmA/KsgA/DIM1 with predicted DNA glycosylase/AP lyase activity
MPELLLFFFLILGSSAATCFALGIGFLLQRKISFLHDPVYVPSSDSAVKIMLDLARPQQGEKAIDFGSGDGRLVIALAEKGCQAVGYEVHPLLVRQSRKKIQEKGLEQKAIILRKSFWQADVSQADIVVLYTTASIMSRLEKKLQLELKPGARVISQEFRFPNWPEKKRVGNISVYVQP